MTLTDVAPLRHDALFYEEVDDLVAQLLPFAREGLARGDAVVAVLPPPNLRALRAALGAEGAAVEFIDARQWYRRPVPTIDQYHRALARKTALGHALVRVIGEVQFGSTTDEWSAWTRYEAALNRAFASQPAWIVCPYGTRTLPAAVLADARRTHSHVHAGHHRSASTQYQPAGQVIASLALVPGVHGAPAITMDLSASPHRARAAVAELARLMGFDEIRVSEIVLTVAEIVANAHLHGGGRATLRAWADPDRLVCEVSDHGHYEVDPLAGYLPPDPHQPDGRGLWIARLLADQVELQGRAEGGLTTWLRFSPTSPVTASWSDEPR